jgi:hypothetical protein
MKFKTPPFFLQHPLNYINTLGKNPRTISESVSFFILKKETKCAMLLSVNFLNGFQHKDHNGSGVGWVME